MEQGTSIKREQMESAEVDSHKGAPQQMEGDMEYEAPINVWWYSTMDVDPLEILSHVTTGHQVPIAKQEVKYEPSHQAGDIQGPSRALTVIQEPGYVGAESHVLSGVNEVIPASTHLGAECRPSGALTVKQEPVCPGAESQLLPGAEKVIQEPRQLLQAEGQRLSGLREIKQKSTHLMSPCKVRSEPQTIAKEPSRFPSLTREIRLQLIDIRLHPADYQAGTGNDIRPEVLPLNQSACKEESSHMLHDSSDLCDDVFSTDQDLFLQKIQGEPAASSEPDVVERIEYEFRGFAVADGKMEEQMSVFSVLREVCSCEEDNDGNGFPLLRHQEPKTNTLRPNTEVASKSSARKPMKNRECKICGEDFMNQKHLARHYQGHNMPGHFACALCNKRFRKKANFAAHIAHCDSRPFKCLTCGKTFNQSLNLKKHSLVHSALRPFKCSTCGKTFKTAGNLKTHSLTHSYLKLFKCLTCGKTFNQLNNLKTHSLTHS